MILLPKGTLIHTDMGAWPVEVLASMKQASAVYDGFGRGSDIVVQDAGPMNAYSLTLDTGQSIIVGEEHTFYSIIPGDSRPVRRPIKQMKDKDVLFLYMPSRKVRLTTGTLKAKECAAPDAIFSYMVESDRIGILQKAYKSFTDDSKPFNIKSDVYLQPATPDEFSTWMKLVGLYGIAVIGHFAKNMLEIDPLRPSCFPTKLFVGRGNDPEDILNDLIDSHIVTPVLPFDQMVAKAESLGIICEGEGTSHLRMGVKPLNMQRMIPMYRVSLTGDCSTVETPWVRT